MKKRCVVWASLLILEGFLLWSGLGIVSSGSLSVTILQIPVILASVTLGLWQGMSVAAVFGIGTMIKAAAYGAETLDHLFTDPCVALIPRLLIALTAWYIYRKAIALIDDRTVSAEVIASGLSALFTSLCHTVLVMAALCLRYPAMLGIGGSTSALTAFATGVIGANAVVEMIVSVLSCALLVPLIRGPGTYSADTSASPMRRSFQKWLMVVVVGASLLTLMLAYALQTVQLRRRAENEMDFVLEEVSAEIEDAERVAAFSLRNGRIGYVVLARNGAIVASGSEALIGKTLEETGMTPPETGRVYKAVYAGESLFCKAKTVDDALLISVMPESSVFENRNETAIVLLIVDSFIFNVVFLLISKLLQDKVVSRIYSVNRSVSIIRGGRLDERVSEMGTEEFCLLSDGINDMVGSLRDTMKQVELKMNEELELASRIQQSALPVAEQVLPAQHDYEVAASMKAAREIGGDFYDYFLIGENQLGFVVADVSGKGVPAALFMMTAKTLIKNLAQTGRGPAEVLTLANQQLCESNDAEMFVTAWLGVLNTRSGELVFANAGHNPPLYKPFEEDSVYMDRRTFRRGLVLGAMASAVYRDNTLRMNEGDSIFLYTDGVTEANNEQGELYGEARLKACLDRNWQLNPEMTLAAVQADMSAFAGGAEQYDDVTMLCLDFNRKIRMGGRHA